MTNRLSTEFDKRFEMLFRASHSAITIGDASGRWIDVNDAFLQLTGYSRAEVIGKTSVELGLIDPDSRAKMLEHIRERGSLKDCEIRFKRKDGSWGYCLSTSEMMRDGDEAFTISIMQDITALREREQEIQALNQTLTTRVESLAHDLLAAEQQYREIFSNAPYGIHVRDIETMQVVDVNEAAASYLGTTREEMMKGIVGQYNVDDTNFDREAGKRLLATVAAGTPQLVEWRVRHPNGDEHWLEVYLKRVVIAGRPCVVSFYKNIDLRKQAQLALQNLNAHLEQRVTERTAALAAANTELGAFNYTISHDLRAPLRAIHGFAGMLRERCSGQLGAEGERYLQTIGENAVRMGNLIDDLLAFSALGTKQLRRESIDTHALVTKVLAQIAEADPYLAKIQVNPLPVAWCDPGLVEQVFTNLVSNAIKYSARKIDPRIEVSGHESAQETVFSIKDNGVGFDMRYQNKLFGLFERLHDGKDYEGTGLGLAIVKRIVEAHGGKVWASSSEGQGAEFSFSLPKGPTKI